MDRQYERTRASQYDRGVPVLGGEAIAHMNADGAAFDDTDNLLDGHQRQHDASPDVAGRDRDRGERLRLRDCLTAAPKADLWILRDQGVDHLTYRAS